MDGRTRRYAFWAILALALAVRLVAGYWWQNRLANQRFAFGDSESYWHLAGAIAAGEPYRYGEEEARIFRTPGYPLLLSPLFVLFGNDPPVMAARALNAMLGTASVAGVMVLARTLLEGTAIQDRASLLAGLATAIDPATITLGVFVLGEAPFTPLMVLHLWAWVLAWKSPNQRLIGWYAALGGCAAGLASLARPSWLLFVPTAALLSILLCVTPGYRRQATKQLAIGAIMLVAICLTMSPWWIRNYTITGRFIPTTLQVGASLYDGLNPHADGSSNMDFVPVFIAAQELADATATSPPTNTFEERLDRRLREASFDWSRAHPVRVAELSGVKFLRLWSPWPNAQELGSFWANFAIAAGYLPLILLGLIGAWHFARRDWSFVLLLLPAVYFTLLHVVFVSSLRYRQPAMLMLAIFAAAVVVTWWDRISKKRFGNGFAYGSAGASPSQNAATSQE